MRNNRTKFWAGLLVIIMAMALSLGACSSSGGGSGKAVNESAPAPAPATDGGGGYSDRSNYGNDDYYEYETPAMAPEADTAYDMPTEDSGFVGSAGDVQRGRKITFRADISINTKRFDADYKAINDMVKATGGYVASESMRDDTMSGRLTGRYSYLSARVPAEGYDSFLDRLSEIGELAGKNKSSDDLTSMYFDTEARIEMLELRKERLLGYLVEAEEAADIVEFERELSNVLYELDAYKGDKRHLDQLVEFATIDINLTELITPETIGKDGEPLGERASEAFALSASGVGRFLEGMAVFFAGAAPVIVLLVVFALIIWAIVRLIRWLQDKYLQSRWGEARQKRKDEAARRRAERTAARQRPPRYQQPPAYQQQMQQPYHYPPGQALAGQGQQPQAGQGQQSTAGQASQPASEQAQKQPAEPSSQPEAETPETAETATPGDPPKKK